MQSLTGLLVDTLEGSEDSELAAACAAGIAIPGRGLCMARSVAYVGLRVNLCGWHRSPWLHFRLWPILVLLVHAGVALWRKLGSYVSALCNDGLH
ncbi:hypothetical protein V6N12_068328 [Hibiscus sabdariffa]|uniref:Uncharacterized protein n=1 Tax=Hibiscus sabdariffa TaxID=183260 RepID=A0ABR2FPT5_9ROSI